jgi:NADH dehydrogenase/NADH:ubiquinone oxidoreductase subunit G
MLRAYVAEADNCVRSLKPSNRDSMIDRLTKTRETIAKLGQSMQIKISDDFHKLKISEIRTTSDFLKKKEEEKESEKEIRAQLREEEKVAKEIAAEKAKLEKERQKIVTALTQMQENNGASDEKHLSGIQEMQATLASIDSGLTGLTERAANTKAGHVYVISNVGAFGSRIIKIGMTRRMDPEDRVKELSDASVPFKYGIHALFFSNNAAGLETALHQKFADKRVNLVNKKREFFFVSPTQVRDALVELDGHVLEFNDQPDDEEFRQSEFERLSLLPPASA